MTDSPPRRVRFGPFELDLKAGELWRGSRAVVLQEQPFRVLQTIVERNGEVVTRQELQKLLWPNDTVVEFDHGINTAIRKIRAALGDSVEKPRYIQTVARRGYRFLVPVEYVTPQSAATPAEAAANLTPERNDSPESPARFVPGNGATAGPISGDLSGKKFSHYRVLEILGGGGMGVVYKGVDLKLDRAVAIKFLPEELGGDVKAIERFEREARAASALDHPNICSIYEFGEHEGRPFIVMQLLAGKNLREVLGETGGSPMPLDRLLEIAAQIAAGLEAAHGKGIIHRDIKPANIFIGQRGETRILDFGVAKMLETDDEVEVISAGESAAPVLAGTSNSIGGATHLTRTGAALGTLGYMSPEQLRGEKLDVRTDLFSFGLILYEMATGQRAFSPDMAAQAATLSERAPSAREKNPALPVALDALIAKALEKDRDQRSPSAASMLAELRRIAGGVTSPGAQNAADDAAKQKRRTRTTLWWAGAALAAVLAVTGIYMAMHARKVEPFQTFTLQKAIDSQHVELTAISPDGINVASVSRDAKGVEILTVHNLPSNTERPILQKPHFDFWDLTYSPDGNYIYFRIRALDVPVDTRDDLYRIAAQGGEPVLVVKDVDRPTGFIDDGQRMCVVRGSMALKNYSVLSTALDGSDERVLMTAGGPLPVSVSCSPDGQRAAITDGRNIDIADFGSGKRKTLATVPIYGGFNNLTWTSKGDALIAGMWTRAKFISQIVRVSYPEGKLRPITNDLLQYSTISLTADGKTIATTQDDLDERFEMFPLANPTQISPHGPTSFVIFNWLDGSRIVGSDHESGLRVVDVEKDQTQTLSRDGQQWFIQPVRCGPDMIVASGGTLDGVHTGMYRMHLDGSGATQITQGKNQFFPQCAAGTDWLYYIDRTGNAGGEVMRVSLTGGTATKLANGFWYSLSPDGKIVAVPNRQMKQMEIYSTETQKMMYALPMPPHQTQRNGFAADSKSIFIGTQLEADTTIWRLPLDKSPAVKIATVSNRAVDCIRASPDGKNVGLITIVPQSLAVLLHDTE
jgi:serine/threonine protein kinase/DNA-binding winged helix-turn-helix (wHTH) protein/Tol biopolymer transport system component